jgi:hypothetical protein
MLAEVGRPPESQPNTFVRGPTPFVETAVNLLLAPGYPPASSKKAK